MSPRNTLNVTAYMDQPSQTRQPSLKGSWQWPQESWNWSRASHPCSWINISKLCAPPACHEEYGATLMCNLQTILSFPLGKVSLYLSSLPLWAALNPQPKNLQRTLSSIWACTVLHTGHHMGLH